MLSQRGPQAVSSSLARDRCLAQDGNGRPLEGILPRAFCVPLRCRRGQSCAREDLQPGSQGLRRNRSRPGVGSDQKHHPHPSRFYNAAHQHLGGTHPRLPSVIMDRVKWVCVCTGLHLKAHCLVGKGLGGGDLSNRVGEATFWVFSHTFSCTRQEDV